jgi:hypothetical protein
MGRRRRRHSTPLLTTVDTFEPIHPRSRIGHRSHGGSVVVAIALLFFSSATEAAHSVLRRLLPRGHRPWHATLQALESGNVLLCEDYGLVVAVKCPARRSLRGGGGIGGATPQFDQGLVNGHVKDLATATGSRPPASSNFAAPP